MNEAGNEARSITVALPDWRRHLDRLRAKHGADTPIGHRCSDLIEQLKNLDGPTGEQRTHLEKFIADSIVDLEKLSAA